MSNRMRIVFAVVLVFVAGFAAFTYFWAFFPVTGSRVVVEGAEVEIDLQKYISASSQWNLLRQPLGDYCSAILRDYPSISSATCRITLHGEVECRATAKRPVALAATPSVYGLSACGEFLPLRIYSDIKDDMPLITGIDIGEVREFRRCYVPAMREALEFSKYIRSSFPDLSAKVSQIDWSAPEAPVLYLRSSEMRIIVGRGNYREKLSRLTLLFGRLSTYPAGELDLRFGRSLVARDLT